MLDIFRSLRGHPLWVQLWMFLVLMPVNLLGLLYWSDPIGRWIGVLGVAGLLPNVFILLYDRKFSKKMAVSHLIPWTILVIWIVIMLIQKTLTPESPVWWLAWAVLAVNVFSLVFDYKESYEWLQEQQTK